MVSEVLSRSVTSDPLTPHFTFERLLREGLGSPLHRDIMRLRYEVYCLECGFLDSREYDEKLESDEYDAIAFHVGAHNLEGVLVGTVRLIGGKEGVAFPFENHCEVFGDFKFPPRDECAEISRLIVRKDFRRRPGDSVQGVPGEFRDGCGIDLKAQRQAEALRRRSNNPQILLGMYREMYRYSLDVGVRYWFAAVERPLVRCAEKIGFQFVPVGPEANYYGPVTPYIIDLWHLHDSLNLLSGRAGEEGGDLSSRWNLFSLAYRFLTSAPAICRDRMPPASPNWIHAGQ